jgi:GntR family transcriptional repressor for pyruvate dehydrogenase complex
MAAQRVSPEDVAALDAMVRSVAPDTSVEDLVAHDLAFHRTISELSGNGYLSSLLDSLSSSTVRARIWRGLTAENAVAQTLAEHRGIVEALAVGDPELTRSLAVVHISGVQRWLRQADRALRGPGPR